MRNEVEVVNVFKKVFIIMGITNNHNFLSNTDASDDPLEKII